MSGSSPRCQLCGASATNNCAKCRLVSYCTKEHQTEDWLNHKNFCMPVELGPIDRYFVAKSDIKEGQCLFSDRVLMIFPGIGLSLTDVKEEVQFQRVCTSCCSTTKDGSCIICGWPMCNKCQLENDNIHSKLECTTLAKNRIQFGNNIISYIRNMVVRVLLMREAFPRSWKILNRLSGMIPIYPNDDTEEKLQKLDLRGFIQKNCRLPEYNDATIDNIVNILRKNLRFERGRNTCLQVQQHGKKFQYGCMPNIHYYQASADDPTKSSLEKLEYTYVATRDIQKGEKLVLSVMNLGEVAGTYVRRQQLKNWPGFSCHCNMCSDSTELGTFLSAIVCGCCKKSRATSRNSYLGYLLPLDPLDDQTVWACNHCPRLEEPASIHNLLMESVEESRRNIDTLDETLAQIMDDICPSLRKLKSSPVKSNSRLLDKTKENVREALRKILDVVKKSKAEFEKKLTKFHHNHFILINERLSYVRKLFFYLATNKSEKYTPKLTEPEIEWQDAEFPDWVALNQELKKESESLLEVYRKMFPFMCSHTGSIYYYLTFSKWRILKASVQSKKDYTVFLEEYIDWVKTKEKADKYFQSRLVPENDALRTNLVKMNVLDPYKRGSVKLMKLYGMLLFEQEFLS